MGECVAQKVEPILGIAIPPVGNLAVHDLGLVWVKFQMPLHEALPKHISEGMRLRFAYTVTTDGRALFRHPPIECIMQKQVGQKRANHRALGHFLTPFRSRPIRHAHQRVEPSFDVEQHPFALGVSAHRL